MYNFILGMAISYLMCLGISKILPRLFIPSFLIAGVAAKVIAPGPLVGSATTKFTLNGSSPLSTHSTEA